MSNCVICGEPMPPGEEMFRYHGYSGRCPKPPLVRKTPSRIEIAYGLLWMTTTDDKRIHEARHLLLETMDKEGQERGINAAKNVTPNNQIEGRYQKVRRWHPRLEVRYWTGQWWEPLTGEKLDAALDGMEQAPNGPGEPGAN